MRWPRQRATPARGRCEEGIISTHDLTLRPLRREEEARFLERVIETSWRDLPPHQQARLTPERIAPSIREIVALLMEQGENLILVADLPEQPNVGQLWLGEARDPYTGARRGYLYDLYVEEAWRGRGIGEALLRAGERASRQRGDQELALTVAAANDSAQALYRSLGFEAERLTLSKPLEA